MSDFKIEPGAKVQWCAVRERGTIIDFNTRLGTVEKVSGEWARVKCRNGLPAELRGRVVQLVAFVSDEDCRFFYPRRANLWQQKVNTFISRALKIGRHARIHRIAISPAEYHAWREARDDTPELRRSYADSFQRLLDP